jgi:Flp pilus assembly protein protease CpaA
MIDAIAATICLAALFIGTLTDIKTREVPDWVNFGLIFTGIGYAVIKSAVYSSFLPIISCIAGMAFFFIFACIMYYTGQWGGGDSKMIIGLGAVIGLNVFEFRNWLFEPPVVINFLLYTLIVGAAYGLVWSIVVSVIRRKEFAAEYAKRMKEKQIAKVKWAIAFFAVAVVVASLFISGFEKIALLLTLLLIICTFYVFIFIKAVEAACMLKNVAPEELTEGDWIAKDIKIGGKYITGPKDLGIEKKSIEKLIELKKKGKIDKVQIKIGIPFVPSFLIAFLLCIIVGASWVSLVLR